MFKLGKKEFKEDMRDLISSHYILDSMPSPPQVYMHNVSFPWLMLGNDNYGDCVFAGAVHETMLWNDEGGHDIQMDNHAVLSDYAAVTGFNPVLEQMIMVQMYGMQ